MPEPSSIDHATRRRGVCLVISAPSGAGKSTIADALKTSDANLAHSVSVTTRKKRPGEIDGVHYHFCEPAEFAALVTEGALLEWANVFGRSYGTPRVPVEEALERGHDVVFDIDWQGHRQLRAALPDDVVALFVLPPSLDALEARLRSRGQDSTAEIERRMAAAREECAHWAEFDYVVVNEDLDRAVEIARAVLEAARHATRRQMRVSTPGPGWAVAP